MRFKAEDMLGYFVMISCFFSAMMYAADLPQFVVISNVLAEPELAQLHQLTEDSPPILLWYGRYNFWRETFEARISTHGRDIVFTHGNEHACDIVTNKLANIFLTHVQAFGVDLTHCRIALEVYLDRNVVTSANASASGMFWHRDSITVDGHKEIAHFSMIILISRNVQSWHGADIVLQLGGRYVAEGSYDWINSSFPEIVIPVRYNQAIIFKNSDTGHMVTPLTPLTNSPVQRDVFIITCYLMETSDSCPLS